LFRSAIAISLAVAARAAAPDSLLLERAGERVKRFWEEVSGVTCTEELSQEKFNEKGKTILRSDSRYDYLILLAWDGDRMLVDESRVEIDPPRKRRPAGSLLATRGFATLLLILHPAFRPGYSFEVAGLEDGNLVRMDFRPRTGGPTPGVLELKDREYPIAWEGSAWIDPSDATVVRVKASWQNPPEALGLRSLTSDVTYARADLRGRSYWLPASARVELHTAHQGWRNVHQFSGYRSFAVEVEDRVGGERR
jgi:hypothetical protein